MKTMNCLKGIASSKRILIASVILAGAATLFCTSGKAQDYPREPEVLGSGQVRWEESQTPDG
ncbi:MAG: hypothetical protein JXB00_20780, partial [Bacteroidales bacterium]|nr:hypothetical protein [Bacteroidales bacterium]